MHANPTNSLLCWESGGAVVTQWSPTQEVVCSNLILKNGKLLASMVWFSVKYHDQQQTLLSSTCKSTWDHMTCKARTTQHCTELHSIASLIQPHCEIVFRL